MVRSSDGDWTGGFFVGQLWLAAAADERNDPTAAAEWAERVLPRAASDTIFRGFLFWYGAAIGHQLLGHDRAGEVALEGALALALANSFHPAARLLPLGSSAEEAHSVGQNETNIDGVPGGAPLLYWAADLTGDESLREKATESAPSRLDQTVTDHGGPGAGSRRVIGSSPIGGARKRPDLREVSRGSGRFVVLSSSQPRSSAFSR